MKRRKKEYMTSINDYLDEFHKDPGQAQTETNQAIVSEEESVKLVLELSKLKKISSKTSIYSNLYYLSNQQRWYF